MSAAQPDLPISDGGTDAPTQQAPAAHPAPPQPAPAVPSDWRESLNPDLKANPIFQRFKSVGDLANAYVHAQRFIGGEKLAAPKETWGEPEWNEFWTALGRPETADQYDLGDFRPPEDLPWDDDLQTQMLGVMHKAGLNHKQAREIVAAYRDQVEGQFRDVIGQIEEIRTESMKSLRQEWGRAFDGRLDLARRAAQHALGDQFPTFTNIKLEGGGLLGDDPRFIRMFARLGETMGEHGLVGDKRTRTTLTPQEAMTEEAKLRGDKGFMAAYLSKEHPEHEIAVQKMADVFAAQTVEEGA